MAAQSERDLRADAKNFCESLGNVFMMKRRDPQTQHLLQKAKTLIEALTSEKRAKSERPSVAPKPSARSGGMGQLWVKLDEMKRENEELKRKLQGACAEDKGSPAKSQGPGDVIIGEMHKTKVENEQLKTQLGKSQTLVKELEKVNHSLQDEFKRTKISLDLANKAAEKAKKERDTLQSSINTIKTENETLKQRASSPVKPARRMDNRFVENINERCRPSNVAVLYNNLESQEWVDAKEALEEADYDDEQLVTRFLCAVLMHSYEASNVLLTELILCISRLLVEPSKVLEGRLPDSSRNGDKLSTDMILSIKEILRHTFDSLDVDPVVQYCKDSLLQSGQYDAFEGIFSNKSLVRYMEQCVRVTWQMVVQSAPMKLVTSHTEFDDEKHKLWWSCSQTGSRNIDFFIWPALFDYEDGNLMVKGCVHTV